MKILWFHSDLFTLHGGGENFSHNLIKALCKQGHKITVVCIAQFTDPTMIKLPEEVMKILVKGRWNRQLGQPMITKIGYFLSPIPALKSVWVNRVQLGISWRVIKWHNSRFAKRAVREIGQNWENYDLAYVHGDPLLASKVSQLLPCCLRLPGPMGDKYLNFFQNTTWICANGDALIKLRSMTQNKKLVIHQLPIGLDADHFSPKGENFRDLIGVRRSDIVLGYAGRITTIKGMMILGQAFCEVAKDIPQLRLLLVGEGAESDILKYLFHKNKLDDRIYWVGTQGTDIMPLWYRSMDLFIMPSIYENYSNAILEAMGCGLPVISSAIGGNLQLVTNHLGWQFKVGDPEDLAHTLRIAIFQKDRWKKMGEEAREIVKRQFSWENTAHVFEGIVKFQ